MRPLDLRLAVTAGILVISPLSFSSLLKKQDFSIAGRCDAEVLLASTVLRRRPCLVGGHRQPIVANVPPSCARHQPSLVLNLKDSFGSVSTACLPPIYHPCTLRLTEVLACVLVFLHRTTLRQPLAFGCRRDMPAAWYRVTLRTTSTSRNLGVYKMDEPRAELHHGRV